MFKLIFREAMGSIAVNKSRTLLTLLGIVIGIASIITVVAAGNGGKEIIMKEFEGFSPRTLQVHTNYGDMRINRLFREARMDSRDLDALEKYVPEIENVTPVQWVSTVIKYNNVQKRLTVTGTNSNYINFVEFELEKGRIITQEEVERYAKVAIIGSNIVKEFFPYENPIGKYFIAFETPIQVVGVLRRKEKAETISFSDPDKTFNNAIVVPVGVLRRVFGNKGTFKRILAKAVSIDAIPRAKTKILKVLSRNHGKWEDKYDKFAVMSMAEQIELINSVVGTITLGVALLAGIALLVAAIGIMNIMLVSVKERTREIGIRKALGAKQVYIMLQFLIETVLLCGGGGLLGLGLAALASFIIGELARWPSVILPETCLIAVGLSLVTGLLSGFYPAGRAARLAPQEALRYE